MNKRKDFQVLIIGSGAAGLAAALHLSSRFSVAVVTKASIDEGCTRYAQGGISSVMDKVHDSFRSHIDDTCDAGAGLCDRSVVEFTVSQGPKAIKWLINLGMPFTQSTEHGEKKFHLTREGGHSHRRVLHAADTTGKQMESTLVQAVRDNPNITVLERHLAIDLITSDNVGQGSRRCYGAYVLDLDNDVVISVCAQYVILASGGAGKVYLYTSNPDVSSGDGLAMAWRAGCRIANMEFIQFHPTCLYHPKAKSFLITEAIRGEGGYLRLANGKRFMTDFDPRGELAPRDIVARAIDHEMKRLGNDCVFLDISHKDRDFIISHFPNIYERCKLFGMDITSQAIPVVPAAHYVCGGVLTNIHGQTDLQNLYAIGEVTCTGLHGANRMASNSLLECLVFAKSASEHILDQQENFTPPHVPSWDESRVTESRERVLVSHNWDELRRMMWDYVGIVRNTKRLLQAKTRVALLAQEIQEYYASYRVSGDLIELRNLVLVADLIIRSALDRKESRGLHFTTDYPETLAEAKNTILVPPA